MSYEQGIEKAARAILRRHRKTGGYRDEARAAVKAFLSAQPTIQWCLKDGYLFDNCELVEVRVVKRETL